MCQVFIGFDAPVSANCFFLHQMVSQNTCEVLICFHALVSLCVSQRWNWIVLYRICVCKVIVFLKPLFVFGMDGNAVFIAFQNFWRSMRLSLSSTMSLRFVLYFDQWLYFSFLKWGTYPCPSAIAMLLPFYLFSFSAWDLTVCLRLRIS